MKTLQSRVVNSNRHPTSLILTGLTAPRRSCSHKWRTGSNARKPSGRRRNQGNITTIIITYGGGSTSLHLKKGQHPKRERLRPILSCREQLLSSPIPATYLWIGYSAFSTTAWLPWVLILCPTIVQSWDDALHIARSLLLDRPSTYPERLPRTRTLWMAMS